MVRRPAYSLDYGPGKSGLMPVPAQSATEEGLMGTRFRDTQEEVCGSVAGNRKQGGNRKRSLLPPSGVEWSDRGVFCDG